jgi:DNA-directed RNA polymerase subunit RPC12/RpoP
MRAPLETPATSDIVLDVLACALLFLAAAIIWDHIRAPRCRTCDTRLHPRTIPELDAAETGLCPTCHARDERIRAAVLAAADCAAPGCTKKWNGIEYVCGRCGRPLALDRAPYDQEAAS